MKIPNATKATANGHHNRLDETHPATNAKPKSAPAPSNPSGDGGTPKIHEKLEKLTVPSAPLKPSGDGGTPPARPLLGLDGAWRDRAGRFSLGNPGGTGNPFARKVAALRSALFAQLTQEKLAQLTAKLFEQAMNGDTAAAKLVLLYTIGKPAETVDPDRLDLDEWKLIDENPTKAEVLRAIFDSIPAGGVVRDIVMLWSDMLTSGKVLLPLAEGKRDEDDDMEEEGDAPPLLRRVLHEMNRRAGRK